MVSRCFPGGYNVKLYISRDRLAWWLLTFLHSGPVADEQSCLTGTKHEVSINFHVHPMDSIILTAHTIAGEVIQLFGTKDATGKPISLDAISLSNGTGEYKVNIQDDFDPTSVYKISSDGDTSVSVEYDYSRFRIVANAQGKHAGAKVRIQDTAFSRKRRSSPTSRAKRSVTFIQACTVPVSTAEVWGEGMFGEASNTRKAHYSATHQANGLYTIQIPDKPTEHMTETINEICGNFKTSIEQKCEELDQNFRQKANILCPKLSEVMTEITSADNLKDFVYACHMSFELPARACEILKKDFGAFDIACTPGVYESETYDLYKEQGSQVNADMYIYHCPKSHYPPGNQHVDHF